MYRLKFLIFVFIILLPIHLLNAGELYKWTDKEGNLHITDDIILVPLEYRDKVMKHKTTKIIEEESNSGLSRLPSKEEEELYGGHPLSWWKNEFELKARELKESEKDVADVKRYIDVFEKGRRLGQRYTQDELDAYKKYKKSLSRLEDNKKLLEEELEELRRKATIYGVPRSIRK